MIRHKVSIDSAILAIIAGLLLQTIIYNLLGINVAEVPARVIITLWGIFAAMFGILESLIGF